MAAEAEAAREARAKISNIYTSVYIWTAKERYGR